MLKLLLLNYLGGLTLISFIALAILFSIFYEYKFKLPKLGLERTLSIICSIVLLHAITAITISHLIELWNYKELLYLLGLWNEEMIIIPPKL